MSNYVFMFFLKTCVAFFGVGSVIYTFGIECMHSSSQYILENVAECIRETLVENRE